MNDIDFAKFIKQLEFAFLWHEAGEDNSWRVAHNWELLKKRIAQMKINDVETSSEDEAQ